MSCVFDLRTRLRSTTWTLRKMNSFDHTEIPTDQQVPFFFCLLCKGVVLKKELGDARHLKSIWNLKRNCHNGSFHTKKRGTVGHCPSHPRSTTPLLLGLSQWYCAINQNFVSKKVSNWWKPIPCWRAVVPTIKKLCNCTVAEKANWTIKLQ